jgi:SAM-dependent methyltransferase
MRLSRVDHAGVEICRCSRCRIEFMNPQYTDAYLQAFYDRYQRDLATQHRFGDDPKPRQLIHNYNLQHIEGYRKPGRFLSVGCGKGIDLKVAAERGWQAEGYDVDADFVATLSEELGLPLRSGAFVELDYAPASFDCVYLNHVLEHPKHPGDYLDKIRTILKPGGVLYVACPNLGSPASRIKNLQDALRLRRARAKHYDSWQHLIYYTPTHLAAALENHFNFSVLYKGSDIKARRGDDQVRVAPMAACCFKSTFRLIARLNQAA